MRSVSSVAAPVALLAAACLLVSPAPAVAQGKPACAAPEHRQFDFWIGAWDVFGVDSVRVGENTIEPFAGSCGLQENWRGARGGTGRSLNYWSPEDRRWHQTWVGSEGSFLLLEGGLKDGSMVMSGATRDSSGATRHRITWTPRPDGTVRQLWEQSKNEGRSWTVAFLGIYRRRS